MLNFLTDIKQFQATEGNLPKSERGPPGIQNTM
jgi:hypothetical protein